MVKKGQFVVLHGAEVCYDSSGKPFDSIKEAEEYIKVYLILTGEAVAIAKLVEKMEFVFVSV